MSFDYSKVDLKGMIDRAYEQMDDLQRPGPALARKSKAVIFDVWMGVGKTFMGLTSGLMFAPQTWIIICSKNAIPTWIYQIKEWFPEMGSDENFVIVRGDKHNREFWYDQSKTANGPLFYLTSAGSFIRDIDYLIKNRIKFDVISLDEPQKFGLRNKKSAFYKAVKALADKRYYPRKLLNIMTGSLTRKGTEHLWTYLNLVDPQVFSSYWRFVHTYNYVVTGPFGKVIGAPRNQEGLAIATSPYIYRVSEEQANASLPPIRRIKLPTEMEQPLADAYSTMAEEAWMMMPETEELFSAGTVIAQTLKLRQLLVCPEAFDKSLGVSPLLDVCIDKMEEYNEFSNWRHNLVFTPFININDTDVLGNYRTHLSNRLDMSPERILVLKGGISAEELHDVEERFRKDPDTLILCSLLYAQSFNLESALNIYFPHFSWSEDDNKQAEARGRRKTSDRSRTIGSYYAHIPHSITEDVFNVVALTSRNNTMTYSQFQAMRERLKKGLNP